VLAAPHYVATAECSFSELDPSAKRMRRLLVNRGVATVESLSRLRPLFVHKKVTILTVAICILRETHCELGVV
jgi:hypothetical protein